MPFQVTFEIEDNDLGRAVMAIHTIAHHKLKIRPLMPGDIAPVTQIARSFSPEYYQRGYGSVANTFFREHGRPIFSGSEFKEWTIKHGYSTASYSGILSRMMQKGIIRRISGYGTKFGIYEILDKGESLLKLNEQEISTALGTALATGESNVHS